MKFKLMRLALLAVALLLGGIYMQIEDFVERVDAKPVGAGWMALCPAHEDHNPSLSIGEGEDGRILAKCLAGCDTEAVVKALGMNMSDLFGGSSAGSGLGRIVAEYDYRDLSGSLAYQVVRFDPKTFRQRRPDGSGGWIWDVKGVEKIPYNLPDFPLQLGMTVYIVEGEKDADRLKQQGLLSTTNAGGAGKWRAEYNIHFMGRDVVVLPDNDESGRKHGCDVVNQLHGVVASVKLINLPGLPEKGDVSDWLDTGHTVEELIELVNKTPAEANESKPNVPEGQAQSTGQDQNQALKIIRLADEADLWRTPDGSVYATYQVNGHSETWLASSGNFKSWLRYSFYRRERIPPYTEALNSAIAYLEARAKYEGVERPVFLRVAETDGKIYIDLTNPNWDVVEISADGWRIVNDPPVRFRRSRSMLPMATPVKGGSLNDLRRFFNVSREEQWRLIVGWLVGAFRQKGPYPILILEGEQGSAKSTAARLLRLIVDPSVAPLRTLPREERDLLISAENSWCLLFDNLSGLSTWISDALCRVSTGGGGSTRMLYTDSEEVFFNSMRPQLLNGIEVSTRHDLNDRAMVLEFSEIPETERRKESEIYADFEKILPSALGALFDAVSAALKNLPDVRLPTLPRMADFAEFVVAAEEALPWSPGLFLEAYAGNREEAVDSSIEADVVAVAIRLLMEKSYSWKSTATELLEKFQTQVQFPGVNIFPPNMTRSSGWPKSAQALSSRIKRAAPYLKKQGIEITFEREPHTRKRLIKIDKIFVKPDETTPTDSGGSSSDKTVTPAIDKVP